MFGAILSRVCRFRAHKSSLHPDQHLLYPDFSLARRRDMPAPRWIHSHHAQPIADSSQMSLSMSHHSDLQLLHTGVLRSPQSLLLDTSLLPPHEPLALRESLFSSSLNKFSPFTGVVVHSTNFPWSTAVFVLTQRPTHVSFSCILLSPTLSHARCFKSFTSSPGSSFCTRGDPVSRTLLAQSPFILSHLPLAKPLGNQFLSSLHDETSLLDYFLSTLFHACCCSRQPCHHVSSIFCALL